MQNVTQKILSEEDKTAASQSAKTLNVLTKTDSHIQGVHIVLLAAQDFIEGKSPSSKEQILERIKSVLARGD